jgi:hypothetical protein
VSEINHCNAPGPVKLPDQQLSTFQPVPKATDLASALKAIQALSNNMTMLLQSGAFPLSPGWDQFYPPFPGGGGAGSKPPQKEGNFVELRPKRIVKKVKIYNPDDREQWVEVEQIVGLTFQDPKSGRTISWRQ